MKLLYLLLLLYQVHMLCLQGIPVIYYGSEQAFSGGGDPENRESLWPNYDEESDMYLVCKGIWSKGFWKINSVH